MRLRCHSRCHLRLSRFNSPQHYRKRSVSSLWSRKPLHQREGPRPRPQRLVAAMWLFILLAASRIHQFHHRPASTKLQLYQFPASRVPAQRLTCLNLLPRWNHFQMSCQVPQQLLRLLRAQMYHRNLYLFMLPQLLNPFR